MRSRKEIENEIVRLKKQLSDLSAKSTEISNMTDSASAQSGKDTSQQMFLLLKYMIEENKKTTILLRHISDSINRLEDSLDESYYEEESAGPIVQARMQKGPQYVKEIVLSDTDAKILQYIQMSHNSMACADEIKAKMSYKGRNAASARLNRLYRLGIIDRYQLGHKVYYKFDAGKATKTLIVSPPQ